MECSEPPSASLPQCKIISSNWYLKPWTAFASGYAIEIAVYTLTTCTCSLLSVKQGQVRVFCYSNKKLTGLQKSNFSIFGRHQTEFARCQQKERACSSAGSCQNRFLLTVGLTGKLFENREWEFICKNASLVIYRGLLVR